MDTTKNLTKNSPAKIVEIAPEDLKSSENTEKCCKNYNISETEVEPPKTPEKPSLLTLILALFAFIFSGTALTFTLLDFFTGDTPITFNSSTQDGNQNTFLKEGSIAEIVSKVSPSVVSITTETRTRSYFGQSSTSTAAGTGIIVTKDGYILTNKHVIESASSISVILEDGTIYRDATVAATDPLNDIAFLKITPDTDLTPATLGDSKTITTGQEVIAIGNALGYFTGSVTTGIISGTGRTITASDASSTFYETLTDLIQTDAAINAGNSGGPLVNAAAEVIGINSATSGSGENIGFAIPIASVKGMLAQLIESGSASRTFLGVVSVAITPSVAEEYDLPVVAGAYLINSSSRYISSAIQKNSPAADAGLRDKDIITAVNGQKIGKSGSLSTLIGEYRPGDTVQLTLVREGHEMALNVTLGSYKE